MPLIAIFYRLQHETKNTACVQHNFISRNAQIKLLGNVKTG